MKIRTLTLSAFVCLAGYSWSTAEAQLLPLELFRSIEAVPEGTPVEPDTLRLFRSELNVRGLASRPTAVSIRIPHHGREVTARVEYESMDRRAGFAERDGSSCFLTGDPYACEIIAIPDLPEEEFSYTWSGQGGGYDLRITVHSGRAVGVLSSSVGRFALGWNQVKELRQEFFRIDDQIPERGLMREASVQLGTLKPAERLSASEASALIVSKIKPKTSLPRSPTTATTQIDMVVLFTEAARIQANLQANLPAGTCSDVAALHGYIEQGINDVNLAFSRSQIDAQLGVVTVARLSGFTLIPDDGFYSYVLQNRNDLSHNANIKAFRDAVGADVVQVLVDTQTNLGPCGVAYVQANDCSDQGDPALPSPCMGAVLSDFSFYMNTVQCSSSVDVFTHELGHVLGAGHDSLYASPPGYQSYPYAYGHSVTGQFETIMSQLLVPSLPRILQFSNPNVNYSGVATGTALRNNAQAISNLAPGVALYRSRPEVIFANGFDSLGICAGVNF